MAEAPFYVLVHVASPDSDQLQEVEAFVRKKIQTKQSASTGSNGNTEGLNYEHTKVDQQLDQFKLVAEPNLEKSKSQLDYAESDNQMNIIKSTVSMESEKKSATNDSADLRSLNPSSFNFEHERPLNSRVNRKPDNLSCVSSSRRFIKLKKTNSNSQVGTEIFGAFCATNLPNTLSKKFLLHWRRELAFAAS